MSGDHCVNCGAAETETYDVQIRNTSHQGVALCKTCHAAIQRELGDGS